ncbi:hypothetical protein EJB05_38257, partial [Eragrostis curvula]
MSQSSAKPPEGGSCLLPSLAPRGKASHDHLCCRLRPLAADPPLRRGSGSGSGLGGGARAAADPGDSSAALTWCVGDYDLHHVGAPYYPQFYSGIGDTANAATTAVAGTLAQCRPDAPAGKCSRCLGVLRAAVLGGTACRAGGARSGVCLLRYDVDTDFRSFDQDEKIITENGYMAPECFWGQFSTKSDVYSYGMVVLAHHRWSQRRQVWSQWNDGKVEEKLDRDHLGIVSEEQMLQALRCVHVALLCVQKAKSRRPAMEEVVNFLSNEMHLGVPSVPGYLSPDDHGGIGYSDNGLTVSILEPR